MAPEAEDLISEIGRLLMTAGDAHYMARQRFNDLRRLLRGQHCAEPAAAQPSGDEPTVEALPRPVAAPNPEPKVRRAKQLVYSYQGRSVSVRELAQLANCNESTMQNRLKIAGMSPEAAVAAGVRMPRGGASAKQREARALRNGKVDAGVAPPAPPARARSVFDVQPTGAAVLAKAHAQQHSPRAFAPDAEVIVPPDVKRTVYQPPTAAAPAPVPSTFGRIGQYEETGTAVSKQYGGSR